ncbi:hypothetical protein Hanom_Chr12g01146221 [Helianthus anomalus]
MNLYTKTNKYSLLLAVISSNSGPNQLCSESNKEIGSSHDPFQTLGVSGKLFKYDLPRIKQTLSHQRHSQLFGPKSSEPAGSLPEIILPVGTL